MEWRGGEGIGVASGRDDGWLAEEVQFASRGGQSGQATVRRQTKPRAGQSKHRPQAKSSNCWQKFRELLLCVVGRKQRET